MITRIKSALVGFAVAIFVVEVSASPVPPPVDCACVNSLPALQTNNCPAYFPDLCSIASSCFSSNVVLGGLNSCIQVPPPGVVASPGTNIIFLTVMDNQTNILTCEVHFIVVPPPNPTFSLICSSNKTIQCGSFWTFDPPIIVSSCCDPFMAPQVISTVTNGPPCAQVITRTWQVTNTCGGSGFCTQTVTVADTLAPQTLCGGLNLVPNGQFESYTNCPDASSEFNYAAPWFTPSAATPDYYNSCSGNNSYVTTPTNTPGVQIPLSGQAYAGAFVYSTFGTGITNSYREYLEVPLLLPLQAGQTYRVSFYVSAAEVFGWAIAEIGAYFSVGPITNYGVPGIGYAGVFNVVPQVVNPAGNLLTSTTAWMLVQGTFVAAGGEDHLTLGNFLSDPATTAVPKSGAFVNYSYYYFDDVSVTTICDASVTNKIIPCGSPWTFDTPTAFDNCSGTNVAISIASTMFNGTCPLIATRNWTFADLCGNTNNWSQTVTITDTNPPIALCSAPTNNLVPNPQFESYTNCPNYTSELDFAPPWFNPTGASADYFNGCAAPGSLVSVPNNAVGVQSAFSGQGYGGAILYTGDGGNLANSYREYLEVPLLAPLSGGQTYLVSFHVSLGDFSSYAIAEVGAHFSAGPLVNYASQVGLPVVPQVVNPPGNLLASTNSWMLVQGLFTAAGGEDHLTLGNFLSDAATTAISSTGTQTWAYYYFDDVSVAALCQPSTNKTVQCGSPITFDPPIGFDACSGTNVTVSLVGTVTNSVCPRVVSRTWALADLCGNTNLWTQTVTVVDNSPPVVNCGCLQDSNLGLLSSNSCAAGIPDLSVLSNSPCISDNCGPIHITQSPAAGTPAGPGPHLINVTISDCAGNTNGCVLPFVVTASPPIVICPKDITLFTCGASAPAYFAPMISGNTGTIVCTPPSGSFFPLNTSTLVTCTVTNDCGLSATCTFAVTVLSTPTSWPCWTIIVIGIPVTPIGSAYVNYLAPLPGGGLGVDFANLGSSGQDGVQLDLGAAQKITFSTVLDFTAPAGAAFNLLLPGDASTGTPGETVLTFTKSCAPRCGWNVKRPSSMTGSSHRSIAIGADGQLFSSFTQDGATLGTNILANIRPDTGVTSVVMTVTLDCLTREAALDFAFCSWTPDGARKGWDGLIYGNGPRGSTTNKTSRLVLTPLTTVLLPPMPTLDIIASNLTTLAFDNPTITAVGRKWNDGHVTLMKAYDDGEQGLEFASFGAGGGVTADLGHASSFRLKISHFENGDIPNEEETFSIRGWPAGTTTNRPPPPPILLRLAQGSSGVDCAAYFGTFGVSNVTLQLWNGTTLVKEKAHVPASLSTPFASISGFPGILSCPGGGILSLASTNPFTVLSGVGCPGCSGTELRILPEFPTTQPAPTVFTELQCQTSDGMDLLFYDLQRTLACTPGPLNIVSTPAGVTLSWTDDGLRLQGAETVAGPWFDLGVTSPATIPAGSNLRVFRLLCD
jgi:hypothetical protein